MAKHQIIYTSCMRGIGSVNDGQQVFSYDAGFSNYKNYGIESLFTYNVPKLEPKSEPKVRMTEEIIASMPSSFSYRLLKNGCSSVFLNTYLGNDYMGSAGRIGNHLSHAIITDFDDMTVYPCELYGGPSLRKSMKYEEVNNPKQPAFLEEPTLEKGDVINVTAVIKFLEKGNNFKYFEQMVVAMLRYPAEKKRIVICDERENIIKWIAALHYALPLEIAKTVNFSTYTFNPELSFSQICGVINSGSEYDVNKYISTSRYYVFDFINMRFNEVDEDNLYIDFLDTAFSLSYDSLKKFHQLIINSTSYREANEEMYDGYYLYSLLKDGFSFIKMDQFTNCIKFAEKYATDDVKNAIVSKILDEESRINKLDDKYILVIIRYLLSAYLFLNSEQKLNVNKIIINRIIVAVSDSNTLKTEFFALYNDIDDIAKSINLSIPAELMGKDTRQKLLSIMEQNVAPWKTYFIIKIISDYVKNMKLSVEKLKSNETTGSIYFQIIKKKYSIDSIQGLDMVEHILDNFKNSGMYLVNMSLIIEGFLKELQIKEIDINQLWDCFVSLAVGLPEDEVYEINKVLEKSEKFETMFALFKKQIENEQDLNIIRDIFKYTVEFWFMQNRKYEKDYKEKALNIYVDAYEKKNRSLSKEERVQYATEILDNAMKMQITDDYVDSFIETISRRIPLEMVNKENERQITQMQRYQLDVCNKKISGRLLLLCIGLEFDSIKRARDIEIIPSKIKAFSVAEGADISKLNIERMQGYVARILRNPLKYSLNNNDLTGIYRLFNMSSDASLFFMEQCRNSIYNYCKEEKNYKDFAEFLIFMFENGTHNDIDITGKFLCKLNKQKIENMDKEITAYIKNDHRAMGQWKRVRSIAESTNPLLNNLSGIFKRKK